eukprot:503133_1
MCANCGPAGYNYNETVSTLRYANRAKNIKNKPKINEDPKEAMLREFQDEIRRLKQQLAEKNSTAVQGTIYNDEVHNGGYMGGDPACAPLRTSDEEVRKLKAEGERREAQLKKQAAEEMKKILGEHARSAEERETLKQRLQSEAEERHQAEKVKSQLQAKLHDMEEKLIQGGKILDKASLQEAELRQAQHELELRQAQELALARELALKEEGLADVERDFKDLREEVDVKTRKLKKLFRKYKQAEAEVHDIEREFQTEREDMLDTIRELARQLKLRELVIAHFVPEEASRAIELRAEWDDDLDTYSLPGLNLTGNALRRSVPRPISMEGIPRPESEYSRQRKQYDSNPRYHCNNIITQVVDIPERTTQEYEGLSTVSRVKQAIDTPLDGEGEEISFSPPGTELIPTSNMAAQQSSSFLHIGGVPELTVPNCLNDEDKNISECGNRSQHNKKKNEHLKKSRRRHLSPSNSNGDPIEFKQDSEEYPIARGLTTQRK